MSNNRINIYINGEKIASEIGAVEQAYRDLNKQVKTLSIGGDDYNKVIEKMSELKGILNDHRQGINGISKGYELAGSTLTTLIGYGAAAFGVDSIITYGREVFKAGVELTALERKAKIVFAETLPAVTKAAEQNATAMGLTTAQYIKAAAEVQDLLVPMGFTRDAASQMSVQLTNLGGVLSEWSGGSRTAAETTEILRKALLGERDALEGLGIQITEEQVKQALQAKGYENLTGKAEEQAKALVTLELIMSKSTDAQEAYATNTDSSTRKLAEMKAALANITEALGKIFIPIFATLAKAAESVLSPISKAVNFIADLADPVNASIKAFKGQNEKFVETNKTVNGLLETYDVLIKKTTLSKDEQIKLNETIANIGAIAPSAITQFGKYGEALAINRQAVVDMMTAEKDYLLFKNKGLLKDIDKEIKIQEYNIQSLQNVISNKIPQKNGFFKDISADELYAERTAALKNYIQDLKGLKAERDKLSGDFFKLPTENSSKKIEPNKAMSGTDKGAEKEADKAAKELRKKLEDIQEIVKKHQDDLKVLDSQRLKDIAVNYDAQIELAETQQQREDLIKKRNYELVLQRDIEAIEAKYQKDIDKETELTKDKSKKVSDAAKAAIIQLDELREKEINSLKTDRAKKQLEEDIKNKEAEVMALAKAEMDAAQKSAEFLAQRKKESDSAQGQIDKFLGIGSKVDSQAEEVAALESHFNLLLKLAEDYGIESAGLKEKLEDEKAQIDKKYKDKEIKTEAEKNAQKIQLQGNLYRELGSIAAGLSDVFQTEGEKQSGFQKLMVLAQIAFDTASAISSLMAASSKNPLNAPTGGIAGAIQYAAGIAQILTAVGRVRKVFAEAPEVKRQKYMGGFETVTGATDGRSYQAQYIGQTTTGLLNYPNPVITPSGVLANEKGREYYISATDLRKPIVMNHVRAIEAIRTQRATGGYAEAPPQYSAPATTASPENMMLLGVLQKQNELLTALLTQGVKAMVGDRDVLDIERRFQELNNLSNGFLDKKSV